MRVEFAIDTTEIDNEIAMLNQLRASVMRGWMEAGRDDENRLVFRLTAAQKARIERMSGSGE